MDRSPRTGYLIPPWNLNGITVATIIQKVVTDFAVEANAKSKELKTSHSLKHKGGMQQIGLETATYECIALCGVISETSGDGHKEA